MILQLALLIESSIKRIDTRRFPLGRDNLPFMVLQSVSDSLSSLARKTLSVFSALEL